MQVKILFFASFREIVGTNSMQLTIDDSSTTATLFHELCELHPSLKSGADQVSIAVSKALSAAIGLNPNTNSNAT
jgi:molybdopterin converting factor small subunit